MQHFRESNERRLITGVALITPRNRIQRQRNTKMGVVNAVSLEEAARLACWMRGSGFNDIMAYWVLP